jgi:hypothetical protein
MTNAVMGIMKARFLAVTELAAGRVSDETIAQARDAHVFGYAEYVAKRRYLDTASPPGTYLYAPVTADDTISNCCGNFLSALGLELMYPDDGERLRQARAGLRRPRPADVGLSTAQIEQQARTERRTARER